VKTKYLAVFGLMFFLSLMAMQVVVAIDFDEDISQEDQDTFDEILDPVMKIYNLVKYSATVLAVVVLLFAGVSYMISGNDPAKREKSKSMAMYVIIGLIVIWAAPLLVNFIVG